MLVTVIAVLLPPNPEVGIFRAQVHSLSVVDADGVIVPLTASEEGILSLYLIESFDVPEGVHDVGN